MDFLAQLMPHGVCLSSAPGIILTNVLGNLAIALVYLVIPLRLWFLLSRIPGRAFVFTPVLKLFGAFVLLCGVTHVVEVLTMFVGGWAYVLQNILLFATAVVSFCALTALITAYELGVKLVSVFTDKEIDIGTRQ